MTLSSITKDKVFMSLKLCFSDLLHILGSSTSTQKNPELPQWAHPLSTVSPLLLAAGFYLIAVVQEALLQLQQRQPGQDGGALRVPRESY